MKKEHKIFLCLVIIITIGVTIFQYVKTFQTDFASAFTTGKPLNGHLWSEMECSQGLCVTSDNKVGIGTDAPSNKLDVSGNIGATGNITSGGDICNASGKCLSSVFQTNVISGSNPTCPAGQTAIMKAYNGTWYTASQVSTWSQVACGQVLSSDGSTLLVNSQHTANNCTSAGGTVIGDGSGNNMCRFNVSSCPSGWQWYQSWSTTGNNCSNYGYYGDVGYCPWWTGHSWSNNSTIETASATGHSHCCYDGDCQTCYTASGYCSAWGGLRTFPSSTCPDAVRTQVGCY